MASIQFKGKQFVANYHLGVPYCELIPRKEKSLTAKTSLHDNLILHGDNLKALKALLPTYAGKVKCIYIDPPYNTGNEGWAYNDAVNSPMHREWLGKVVDREDMTRHDKWLCMMMPRLKLLRDLLREDGVIFVSIDDNEVAHLRMLMDEVFGEENFISEIVWHGKYTTSNDAKNISRQHEYILFYTKSINNFQLGLLDRTEEMDSAYKNPDNDSRGSWKATPLHAKSGTEKSKYTFKFKNGISWSAPSGRFPRFSSETLKKMDDENRIWFGKDGKAVPNVKTFLSEVKQGKTVGSVWGFQDVGSTHKANEQLSEIFGKGIFENPKAVDLIKQAIKISTNTNDLILDSFAGSGTTAHAVLALNAEDGGNRKFILVECEEYADTITAERVRRIIKGVPSAKNEKLKKGFGGSFSYFDLGKEIEMKTILNGKRLPSYRELARYVFYTATGEEWSEKALDEKRHFIGESREYEVYLFYEPDAAKLRSLAFNLTLADKLGKPREKKRLVFAPTKFLNQGQLEERRIVFSQLPFEIYQLTE